MKKKIIIIYSEKNLQKNAFLRCLAGSDEGIDIVCDNTNLASMAVGLSQLNTK